MTIIDVGIISFAIVCFHIFSDIKKDKIRTNQLRELNQKNCQKTRKYCNCDPQKMSNVCNERFGVPRRWYEKKTYKEQINEENEKMRKEMMIDEKIFCCFVFCVSSWLCVKL